MSSNSINTNLLLSCAIGSFIGVTVGGFFLNNLLQFDNKKISTPDAPAAIGPYSQACVACVFVCVLACVRVRVLSTPPSLLAEYETNTNLPWPFEISTFFNLLVGNQDLPRSALHFWMYRPRQHWQVHEQNICRRADASGPQESVRYPQDRWG